MKVVSFDSHGEKIVEVRGISTHTEKLRVRVGEVAQSLDPESAENTTSAFIAASKYT